MFVSMFSYFVSYQNIDFSKLTNRTSSPAFLSMFSLLCRIQNTSSHRRLGEAN